MAGVEYVSVFKAADFCLAYAFLCGAPCIINWQEAKKLPGRWSSQPSASHSSLHSRNNIQHNQVTFGNPEHAIYVSVSATTILSIFSET